MHKKNSSSPAIILLIMTLFTLTPTLARAASTGDNNLLLLYSNDVKGETEACG